MNTQNELIKSNPVKFQDFTREKLCDLINVSFEYHVPIETMEKNVLGSEQKFAKEKETRYAEEKDLCITMLFTPFLSLQIRRNVQYDYMIGFLLYLTSNCHFNYSFGYFKKKIELFDNIMETWDMFLNHLIDDVNSIPELHLSHKIKLEFNNILCLSIQNGTIVSAKIIDMNFEKIFDIKEHSYHYNVYLTDEISAKNRHQLIESGRDTGNGELKSTFANLNNIISIFDHKSTSLISAFHNEFI